MLTTRSEVHPTMGRMPTVVTNQRTILWNQTKIKLGSMSRLKRKRGDSPWKYRYWVRRAMWDVTYQIQSVKRILSNIHGNRACQITKRWCMTLTHGLKTRIEQSTTYSSKLIQWRQRFRQVKEKLSIYKSVTETISWKLKMNWNSKRTLKHTLSPKCNRNCRQSKDKCKEKNR